MSLFKKRIWELVEEGKRMRVANLLLGIDYESICDVYRRQKRNGIYEYKCVPRY